MVVGTLDRQFRLATDRASSFQRVLSAMNAHGRPVTLEAFLSMVQVVAPADARVTELAGDRRAVDPGEKVQVTATVLNPASIPGETGVTFRLDGRQIATRSVRLGPSTSRTVTVPVELDAAGIHRITAANATVTVRAGLTPSPTANGANDGPGLTTTDGPPLTGFGFGLGVVAAGLLALVARFPRA